MSHKYDARTVLAIDPGKEKCGIALVSRDVSGKNKCLWRKIVKPLDILEAIEEASSFGEFSTIVVGNGTTSRDLIARLRDEVVGRSILLIDEKDTSVQARERYWIENKRKGLQRFVPSTLLTPPTPIDDYVAIILAERVLNV